jgi:AcrR family transcriptional regulator
MFEEFGYYGAGLEAVAKRAGVSRQAIYLHFPSKVELLTALHLHIYATDVVPAQERYPVTGATTAWDALDATISVHLEVVAKVWRINEALVVARRQYPEVDDTLRPREEERYDGLLDLGRRLEREGLLPPTLRVDAFADVLWALMNIGTYRALVIDRGWSPDRYGSWVRDTIRLQIGAPDHHQ